MNWAYLAGFFDGDGHVGLSSGRGFSSTPRVAFAQAGSRGKEFLQQVKEFLLSEGIASGQIYEDTHSKLSSQSCFALVVANRKDGTHVLQKLIPFLHIKKLEAQDVLRFFQFFPPLPRGGKRSWETRKKETN